MITLETESNNTLIEPESGHPRLRCSLVGFMELPPPPQEPNTEDLAWV